MKSSGIVVCSISCCSTMDKTSWVNTFLSWKHMVVALITVFMSHLAGSMLCRAMRRSDGDMGPSSPPPSSRLKTSLTTTGDNAMSFGSAAVTSCLLSPFRTGMRNRTSDTRVS